MTEEQFDVLQFMELVEQEIPDLPCIPCVDVQQLRVQLIQEELLELQEAFDNQDLVGVADALADLLYVVYGAGIACGIDLELIFAEVHLNNMKKKENGRKREDGKWEKPEGFIGPEENILRILSNQIVNGGLKEIRIR